MAEKQTAEKLKSNYQVENEHWLFLYLVKIPTVSQKRLNEPAGKWLFKPPSNCNLISLDKRCLTCGIAAWTWVCFLSAGREQEEPNCIQRNWPFPIT